MYYTITEISDPYDSVEHFGAAFVYVDVVTTWRGHHQLNEDRHEVRAWSTRPFVTVKISRHDHIEDDVTAYTAVRAPWPAAREPALWGDTCGLPGGDTCGL